MSCEVRRYSRPGSQDLGTRNSRFENPYRRRFPGAGNFSVNRLTSSRTQSDCRPGTPKTGNRNAAGNEWSNGNGTHEEHRPRPPPGRPQRGARRAGPAQAPGTSPVPGSAAVAVHAALTANPGATAAVIATAAGISRPAARDALAALETAGAVTRIKGGKPGIADTWTLAAPGPSGSEPAAGPGHDDEHAVTGQPAEDPAGGEQDGGEQDGGEQDGGEQDTFGQQEEASGAPASADGAPDPDQASQPDGDPAEGSPAGEDTGASHEQDETAPPADGSAPAGTPPDPALVADIAGHIGQIQAAASAAATALAGGGDLRAVRAGLDEIYEQAAQARRAARAAAGGKKAPAARPGGLREKVLAHLRANPGSSFTPHEIHKVTGHSSGAIANALDTLVKHGDATLASEKPRRFRLAGSTAAAADAQAPAEPGTEDTGAGEAVDLAGAA